MNTDMWQCNYADETVDKKLFWLCVLKRLWIVAAGACAMSLLIGGSYWLTHTVLVQERQYRAQGDIYIEYIPEEGYGISTVYLNEDVWKALVKSDAFVQDMSAQLAEQGITLDEELLRQSVDAVLVKDTRIVTAMATTTEPALSTSIAAVLQQALLNYGEAYRDIESAYVLTAAGEAEMVLTDEWTGRLFLLGAVLGVLVFLTAVFLTVTLDDSVYVPEQFERRYGIPMFGILQTPEAEAGLRYGAANKKTWILTAAQRDLPLNEIAGKLQEALPGEHQISALPVPDEQPGTVSRIREADGILLAVESGRHDGKRIEKLLRFLDQQGCPVLGAVLWNQDQRLIRQYYGYRKGKRR